MATFVKRQVMRAVFGVCAGWCLSGCERSATGVPRAPSTPTPGASVATIEVPKTPATSPQLIQPKVKPTWYGKRGSECQNHSDCPEPPFCQRAVCYYGHCVAFASSDPDDTGACVVDSANGLERGRCLAGQCVTPERWPQTCGRIYGQLTGGSDPGRRPERFCFNKPPERCERLKTEGRETWLLNMATGLVQCMQFPEAEPPASLNNWDGNDSKDLGSYFRKHGELKETDGTTQPASDTVEEGEP
jgi:hypothetical protein